MQLLLPILGLVAMAATAPLAPAPRQAAGYSLLQTQLISGPARFDKLHVYSYHTGAGLSDATLAPTTNYAAKGFLNGSNWQLDLGNDFPWFLIPYQDTNYAAWEDVKINAGEGYGGFYFNETAAPGLLWYGGGDIPEGGIDFDKSEFQNWLVCDWSHGVPQLFWHVRSYNVSVPAECGEAWLVPVDCA